MTKREPFWFLPQLRILQQYQRKLFDNRCSHQMLLLLPSVSYLPFFRDFIIVLKFAVKKKSPRITIPMFYNERRATVLTVEG